MTRLVVCLAACLAMLTPASGSAQGAADAPRGLTREAALAALAAAAPEQRLRGIDRLATIGGDADAPALTALLRDPDSTVRSAAERTLWLVWGHSGDAAIDRLYQRGVALMGVADYAPAVAIFNRIIGARPDFAEGWNKRATLYFMLGEYRLSLRDCDEVIKRNPDHFGALSGYGQIYLELEEYDKALEYFRKALAVNPNMQGVAINIERIEAFLRERRGNMI